jgi:hypothetical protein
MIAMRAACLGSVHNTKDFVGHSSPYHTNETTNLKEDKGGRDDFTSISLLLKTTRKIKTEDYAQENILAP